MSAMDTASAVVGLVLEIIGWCVVVKWCAQSVSRSYAKWQATRRGKEER